MADDWHKAQAGIISGRLAIQGVIPGGVVQQNHDLVFRHSPDKGHRVLRKLLDRSLNLPRWGSHQGTAPPSFESLKFYKHTDRQDFEDFSAACAMDADGTRWWRETEPVDWKKSTTAKSHGAARIWLHLHVHPGESVA